MKPDERVVQCPSSAEDHLVRSFWRRAVWMRLGALNGLIAFSILLLSNQPIFISGYAGLVRQAAQVQFMHGMATLACATFMNIGAGGARMAPGFFLSGVGLYCLPIYLEAIGVMGPASMISRIGLVAVATGWLILAWSARDIDKV